jgi:hypothetical protein
VTALAVAKASTTSDGFPERHFPGRGVSLDGSAAPSYKANVSAQQAASVEERMASRAFVWSAAAIVFGICTYVFLLGNKVFEGKFDNDHLAWYFFAKGIFCAVSLLLSQAILEVLRSMGSTPRDPPEGGNRWSLPR